MMDIVPDDVVISGIGGYFPKAKNVEEFKKRLFENEVLIETRWPEEQQYCNKIGCVDANYFDNSYFGIHRQQCFFMDPMHRLALERTFEALIDAGVNPVDVRGKRVGVFMGSTIGENDQLFVESVVSGFGVTGHSRAMLANRISYWLNLKGPSVAYDSNWVSGIDILRLAYYAIKTGQCDSVIIGTANLAQHSSFQHMYNEMGVLSQDGSTRAFDANATGYARSEGVVALYIQKSSDVRRLYANVVQVASKFDGTTAARFADVDPSKMVEFLDEFYKNSKVKPDEIEFVEAYGCGIKKIDKSEIDSFEKVLCKNRSKPLLVGSVKTVTGHAEPTSALFSIIKTIIAMETDTIPATLQFNTPNPEIQALHNGKINIVTTNRPWNPTYAAVNAIGTSSHFGHVILKANPKKKLASPLSLPALLFASTRTEEGIQQILETLKTKPKDPEYYTLIHDIFSKSIQGHLYRGYLLLGEEETKQEIINHMGNKRPVWFVYSGMGSQWNEMLGDLMKIEVFAKSIKKSCDILAKKGVDLLHILSTSDKATFGNILNCFVGIAAMQIALTDVLWALGIVPDGIIGHSVGELGCAYADGCMTAEQMILSSYSRGRASVEATLIKGMMAAIGLGYNQIKDTLPPTIEVACHNGPDSCTISGPAEDMEKYVKTLQDRGVFAKLVNVADIAYHSRYIKPAAPLLLKYLKEVLPKPMERSQKWISTSNLEHNWDTDLARHSSADYHTNNLLSSVLFEEGIKHIPKDSILIEIAPHGLLQAILKRAVKDSTNIPLTHRGTKSGCEFLLQSLGKLYLSGLDMKLSNIYPKIDYPVSRGTPSLSDLVHWNHSESWSRDDDVQKTIKGIRNIDVGLMSKEYNDWIGHKIYEQVVVPASAYLNIILQITENAFGGHGIIFQNLHFKKNLILPSVPINAMIQKGSGEFEIFSGDELLVKGKLTIVNDKEELELEEIKIKSAEGSFSLTENDIYNELEHRGYNYETNFKLIKNITFGSKGSVATTKWTNQWTDLLEAMIQQQLFNEGERYQEVHVPKYIQKISICHSGLPTTEEDINISYEYSSRILSTPGIELQDMKTMVFKKNSDDMQLNSLDMIKLEGDILSKIESGIERALQLAISNFRVPDIGKIYISELETNINLQEPLKNVLSEFTHFNVHSVLYKDIKEITIIESSPQLLIVNDLVSNDVLNLLANSESVFLLSKMDPTQKLNSNFSVVTKFRCGADHYVITKTTTTKKPSIVTIKEKHISIRDLEKKTVSWVKDLYNKAKEANDQQSFVLLVTSTIPTEGFNQFLETIRSTPNLQNVRIFFNIDQNPDALTEASKKDLALIILKDKQWFTYLPLLVRKQDHVEMKSAQKQTPTIINNKLISYIGLNLKDETLSPELRNKNEIGNIDYCGVAKNGERVIGLAYLDKETSKLVVDDIFIWEVPKDWELESAVTVPHAYASAYYMLVVKAGLKYGDTVLIHAGCSPIGLAAISVCYSYGCQIYTTVATDKQKAFLKKQLPFVQARNILDSNSERFESDLMFATGGKGAEVVLNCVSGRLLRSSVACMADYGRFIQYGKYDMEQGNSIGMNIFLKNVSFYHVDLQNIFHQDKEVKQLIRNLISEGFEKYVVRPLCKEIISFKDISTVMKKLESPEIIGKIIIDASNNLNIGQLNVKEPTRFACNPKSSYLIFGGPAEFWVSIAEWLVYRGARKIVISTENKPIESYLHRRLTILENYFGADIITASTKVQTKENAVQLISEVANLGSLHVVFTLPSQSNNASYDSEVVEHFDSTLRKLAPEALLVNFINSATGLCYQRADAKFSTKNIQVSEQVQINNIVFSLDFILYFNFNSVVVKKQKSGATTEDNSKSVIKDLTKLVPSIDDIIQLQKNAPNEPEFLQVLTEGPVEIRELAPLFIIPGLTGYQELAEFVKHLLYPTFCAVLPSTPWSFEKLAEVYAQRIYEIYPDGVYNIVSISSGGALAIEIARKLSKKKNVSLHLYFIDSVPSRIQQGLQALGENMLEVEVNILRTIFKMNDLETIKQLKNCKNYEARTKLLLQQVGKSEENKMLLERGLIVVKDLIAQITSFKPNDELIPGRIHLLVPDDCSTFETYGLSSYCKNIAEVTQIPGDHLSIIRQWNTHEYVNKNHSQD